MAIKSPPPSHRLTPEARVIEFAEFSHHVYGILIQRLFSLLGGEVQDCPFVALLVLILAYQLISR